MSLARATAPGGTPTLPGGPPYPCEALVAWRGLRFELPPGDPRLPALAAGGAEPSSPMANLAGAYAAWESWSEGMDFLDAASPVADQKRMERDLYLHLWDPWLSKVEGAQAPRVLDLGGGIGRFSMPCLDAGWDVDLVDPDLESLRRAVWHAAGRPGRLDVYWTTGEHLPETGPYDLVFAVEVFCYVEDPVKVLANVRARLRPGGRIFFSVEAEHGWAACGDAAPGTLEAFLSGTPVHAPGDRFVRTYSAEALRALFSEGTIESLIPTHYVLSGPFEAAAGPIDLTMLLDLEARLRAHRIAGPLNRAWTGVVRYD